MSEQLHGWNPNTVTALTMLIMMAYAERTGPGEDEFDDGVFVGTVRQVFEPWNKWTSIKRSFERDRLHGARGQIVRWLRQMDRTEVQGAVQVIGELSGGGEGAMMMAGEVGADLMGLRRPLAESRLWMLSYSAMNLMEPRDSAPEAVPPLAA